MVMKASTGLRNHMLSGGSAKDALDGGLIHIYAGAAPATADDAIGSATLLCTISLNSTGSGISFDTAAAAGVLSKAPAEVWSGVNAASGAASFCRHVAAGDDGTLSTTQPRIQGDVAVAGALLNLSSINLVAGATQTVDFHTIALPTI